MGFRIQNPTQNWNPESTFHWQSRNLFLKSGIYGVESRIQDCLEFSYMGQGPNSRERLLSAQIRRHPLHFYRNILGIELRSTWSTAVAPHLKPFCCHLAVAGTTNAFFNTSELSLRFFVSIVSYPWQVEISEMRIFLTNIFRAYRDVLYVVFLKVA